MEHTPEGVLLKPLMTVFAPTFPENVFGCLSYAGQPKSVEQMDAGIAAEARRRYARGRYQARFVLAGSTGDRHGRA